VRHDAAADAVVALAQTEPDGSADWGNPTSAMSREPADRAPILSIEGHIVDSPRATKIPVREGNLEFRVSTPSKPSGYLT